MPIRMPVKPFRIDLVDVVRVEREVNNEPIIKYVDREVIKVDEKIVYRDDPALLKQLNNALKENGMLRTELSRKPKEQKEIIEKIEKEISGPIAIKFEEKKENNLLNTLMLVMAGGIVGAAICLLIRL